jgi:P4 family phage/plasmid primase-like protien
MNDVAQQLREIIAQTERTRRASRPANDAPPVARPSPSPTPSATRVAPTATPAIVSTPPTSSARPASRDFDVGDEVEIAKREVERLGSHAVFDAGATHVYAPKSGLYDELSEAEESCNVQQYSGAEIGSFDGKSKIIKLSATSVAGVNRLVHARLARPGFFDAAPRGLAFADCFVEVNERGIVRHAHAPEHRARHGYAFRFDAAAPATSFNAALREWFFGASDAHERIQLLQEYLGASLLGIVTRYQLALVLLGAGANGKSAALSIFKSAFPPGSVASIPPHGFGNPYLRAALSRALLNALSETPEDDLIDATEFKAVVSGDEIVARQIYKAPFYFRPRAGHLLGANRLWGANDTSHGLWRRLAVVGFDRRFEGAAADETLPERIAATERPGIVRWMLEGAERLIRRGRFVLPSSSVAAVTAWRQVSNPVATFFADVMIGTTDEAHATASAMVYTAYREWAARSGHAVMSSTKFGLRMKELGFPSRHTRRANVFPVRFRRADEVGEGCEGLVTGCEANSSRDSKENPDAC